LNGLLTEFGSTRSALNAATLEAIATVFALEVPNLALLVLPANGPVQRVVQELRTLGVDARELDLRRKEVPQGGAENPSLLVGTLATSRGLDLPELTHVFLVGMLEGRAVDGRAVDSYVHVAGRVGRFGRSGKVVSVVEEDGEERMRRVVVMAGFELY
jgi:primosomal protein N'